MNVKRHIIIVILIMLLLILLFNSRYSIRLSSAKGDYYPVAPVVGDDYYRGMQVIELDTVLNIGTRDKDYTYLIDVSKKCPSGKIHTVEYRNTLGGILLSAFTFGRKRMVRIKYVCMDD
ncbi:hypothetical protein [Flagellimonas onchidii]|uniref:hypothetical protein n=1 Tax=Flagellimonas onchidii TaxID=2562684 RepID=UPI0010A5CC60|nr:hypothetical protein [Allomuricauda onchidii]